MMPSPRCTSRGYDTKSINKMEFLQKKITGTPAAEPAQPAINEAMPVMITLMQQLLEQVDELTERDRVLAEKVSELTEEVRSLKSSAPAVSQPKKDGCTAPPLAKALRQ